MLSSILCLALFVAVLLAITKPLGLWIAPLAEGRAPLILTNVDRTLLRCLRIDNHGQTWWQYARSVLVFNIVGCLFLYAILRLQNFLPLNPQGFAGVEPLLALNTAISFVTNTNWQAYGGETTLSHFSQMTGLTVQNFLSATSGICTAFVLMRGFAQKKIDTLGNFWADATRVSLWLLLPISVIYAVFLITQGAVQTLDGQVTVTTLSGAQQSIALGPVASQEAIKLLGTNGGGFFNTNSAHPFENPTQLANFVECLSIFAISAALLWVFGRMVKNTAHGWTLWGAVCVIFVLSVLFVAYQEGYLPPEALQAGATGQMNMEGKEVRFDLAATSLFAVVTTAASCGAVNAMFDSFMPLAGMIPMWLIQLGEVVFGGVGAGFYGLIVFAIITVFIAGLMVGRTPEYLGKKITPVQMKTACLAMLVPSVLILLGTALTCLYPDALSSLTNNSAHGLSEFLYAWSSASNNNGSAFAGLNANTPFFNIGLGVACWVGRFAVIIAVLALAGSLSKEGYVARSSGTLSTEGLLFATLLIGVILLVGALTYLPGLALGPIAEEVSMGAVALP